MKAKLYAKGMHALACCLMCETLGLESSIIEGTINGVNHVWNKVLIEDQWYHFDLTSDDILKNDETVYDYFGMSDEEIAKTHDFIVTIPLCTEEMNVSHLNIGFIQM